MATPQRLQCPVCETVHEFPSHRAALTAQMRWRRRFVELISHGLSYVRVGRELAGEADAEREAP